MSGSVHYTDTEFDPHDQWSVKLTKKRPLSKALSRSTPSLLGSNLSLAPRSSITSTSSTSSSREKKFHRYFTEVSADERILNYYSCALVSDILLQGHLYITPNYFAFHSNIFGYVTKVLIPTESVHKITKEKVVKIIPSAIAITTDKQKYVFCSLLSRESTFKLLKQVWEDAKNSKSAADIAAPVDHHLLDDETSISEGGNDDTFKSLTASTKTNGLSVSVSKPTVPTTRTESPVPSSKLWNWLEPHTIIVILVVLLIALYISAALMMIRIHRLHTAYLDQAPTLSMDCRKDNLMQYIDSHLDQILKVRQSLETLSEQFVLISKSAGVIASEDVSS